MFLSSSYYVCSVLLLDSVVECTYYSPNFYTEPDVAFNPLQHLGGQSPWFPGPNVNDIPYTVPDGCVVDMAAFTSRHGSRYPDPAAYQQWVTLYQKIQNATFTARCSLSFLPGWQPVLSDPSQELSQLSSGGYQELYSMGVEYRWRYPSFYKPNTPFILWSNEYAAAPRVVDSARLFARGYIGPNATSLGAVYVLNSTDPRSLANSLAPSDLCPNYHDDSGGENATTWADIYLPPITARLNALLDGSLAFTTSDVAQFPVLCGYETQIIGRFSPWCNVFTKAEITEFDYAQDIRYYYGSGPGSGGNSTFMLPFLAAVVQRFLDGPDKTYLNANATPFTPPLLIATFTNDGQINQLAAQLGVFDDQEPLPADRVLEGRRYITSNYVSMRGTIGFERLSCVADGHSSTRSNATKKEYMRIVLNNAVYPVVACQSGPGRSCPLQQYAALVYQRQAAAGDFGTVCNKESRESGAQNTTFLMNPGLPFEYVVRP